MRILLVVNTLPPDDVSGVGEQVLQLAAGLEALGHEVRVLGRPRHGVGASKLLFPLTVVPAMRRELARFRPHLVQTHESDGALALLVAAIGRAVADPRPRLSVLLQVSYCEELRAVRALRDGPRILGRPGGRELLFKFGKAPLQVLLGWLSAELADVVLAPSRQTAAEVSRDYRVDPVAVLPNVMGGRRVEPETDASIAGARDFLLYVGRLRIRKGVEVLLESLVRLGRDRPQVFIVGDGEHAARLRQRLAALDLAASVRLLGRRTPGQVRYLMRHAGALVVPSIYEGMPLVVLEAMQAGLPVIATRVSGIPEVVTDGETGWLVAAEDPAALAAAIRAWRRDRAEGRRRGAAGQRRLEERYSPRGVAERWLHEVVERGGGAARESVFGAAGTAGRIADG
jgi:glycosyltransferase involved in cell wall biosynthesis